MRIAMTDDSFALVKGLHVQVALNTPRRIERSLPKGLCLRTTRLAELLSAWLGFSVLFRVRRLVSLRRESNRNRRRLDSLGGESKQVIASSTHGSRIKPTCRRLRRLCISHGFCCSHKPEGFVQGFCMILRRCRVTGPGTALGSPIQRF